MSFIRPMPLLRGTLLATCSGLALAIAAPRADAAPLVGVTWQYVIEGGAASGSFSNTDPAFLDEFPQDYVGNSSVFGHHYAYDNGTFGTGSYGTGNFDKSGTASWSNSFTNTGTTAISLVASFMIEAGQVSISSYGPGEVTAGVSAQIKVDGNAVFTSAVDMEVIDGGMAQLTQTGSVLASPGQFLADGGGFYDWGSTFGSLNLGLLAPNQTVTVDYVLASYVTSNVAACGGGYGYTSGLGEEGYGGDGYGGDGDCYYANATARIGDPIQIEGSAFAVSLNEVSTPEPASAALLGAGLAGLALRRRRAAKA